MMTPIKSILVDTVTASDLADDIISAVEILGDLLNLALRECINSDDAGNAESAIRAARRYAEDVHAIATGLVRGAA